jgi:hypothetical protein
MEVEISEQVGAELGEVAPGARVTHRNGYRPRPWESRVGEIELLIPRARHGSYLPSFVEPRRRSEPAIVAVVTEAYLWLDKHVKGHDHGRVVSKRWSSPMQCTRADCGSYVLSPLAAPHHRRGGLVRFRPCTGLGLSALLPAAVEATPG